MVEGSGLASSGSRQRLLCSSPPVSLLLVHGLVIYMAIVVQHRGLDAQWQIRVCTAEHLLCFVPLSVMMMAAVLYFAMYNVWFGRSTPVVGGARCTRPCVAVQ